MPNLPAARLAPLAMVIEGHDWRFTGDGWRWRDRSDPLWTGTWDDLVRVGYTAKVCMTCGFEGKPDDEPDKCHVLWANRTGHLLSPSASPLQIYQPRLTGQPCREASG